MGRPRCVFLTQERGPWSIPWSKISLRCNWVDRSARTCSAQKALCSLVEYPGNPTSLRPQLYYNNRALSTMQLQLSALLSLLTVALFAVPTSSQPTLDIEVYDSVRRSIGARFTFRNIAPGTCCNLAATISRIWVISKFPRS